MATKRGKARLSSLDAFFLYNERRESPLNIGGVSIFDGRIELDDLVESFAAKIDQVPRYRDRLVRKPLDLGHPIWELDPGFDLRRHLFEVELESPGSEAQLGELASRLMSEMLDRSKPLWDLVLVQGLEGGRSAFISRIHHCMVDGVSGVDLMKIMFDLTPTPPPLPPVVEPPIEQDEGKDPRTGESSEGRRLFEAVLSGLQEGLDRAVDLQNGLIDMALALGDPRTREAMLLLSHELPGLLSPVELLPFNGPLSGERKFVWLRLPFAEARAIRGVLKGSVNDVILTLLAGAVSSYLAKKGESGAGHEIRILVPVNLRQEQQHGALGNLISVLPVEIPLGQPPLETFRTVNGKTAIMKQGRMAEIINLALSLFGTIPAPLQSLLGILSSSPIPPFNMIATNVPGPQIPLYSHGRRLLSHYPFVPTAFAIGFGVAILSYDQNLCLGLTSDRQAFPDVELMRDCIAESFSELMEAAGIEPIAPWEISVDHRLRQSREQL